MNENTQSSRTAEVVVIGGGLAGLAAAAYVAKAGRTVTVVEGRGRLGGRATTDDRNGFRFNQGPHALYRGGPAEEILGELGVRVDGAAPRPNARLVFDGELHIGPSGPWTLLRTGALSPKDKLEIGKLFGRLPRLDAAALADTTVDGWLDDVTTRQRPRELGLALVRLATYTNQPDELSADVAVGQIQSALASGVLYLHRGWQQLVDQLVSMPGVGIESAGRITELPDAQAVVLATGGPDAAAELLGHGFDVGPSAKAGCVDLGLRRRPTNDFVLGGDIPFYFSNHSSVADLAPEGHWHCAAVQYLQTGGRPDGDSIRQFAIEAGVDESSIVEERFLHAMTTVTAIPTASRGGVSGRPAVDATGHANVFLAGDWVGPIGHLADAALASGRDAARAALRQLDRQPAI